MIIGQIENPQSGGKILLVGLSSENISRMMNGDCILINPGKHGPAVPNGWEIVIMHGASEAALFEQLKQYVDKTSIVKIDPRLGIDPST